MILTELVGFVDSLVEATAEMPSWESIRTLT